MINSAAKELDDEVVLIGLDPIALHSTFSVFVSKLAVILQAS